MTNFSTELYGVLAKYLTDENQWVIFQELAEAIGFCNRCSARTLSEQQLMEIIRKSLQVGQLSHDRIVIHNGGHVQ
jgi:hypothetical protein